MQKSLVRIVSRGGDLLLSRGVMVTAQGAALADRDALVSSGFRQFEAILPDGKRYPATLRAAEKGQALAVLDIAVGTSTGFVPAPLADEAKVRLGQSVIRIGGTGSDSVGSGIIASLPTAPGQGADAHSSLIEASVSSATPGSVLMTLSGEMIGITTGPARAAGPTYYTIPAQNLIAPPASS
jgi:S1-C subfamily serine protease